jgi:hypothetical protein
MNDNRSTASSPVDRAVHSALASVDMPDRYPSGTSFIAADLPSFDAHFRRVTSERRPIVVVLPDGEEVLLQPRHGGLARVVGRTFHALARRLSTHRSRDGGPLVQNGAPGEPFDIPLMRLSVAGYETHLYGLRR